MLSVFQKFLVLISILAILMALGCSDDKKQVSGPFKPRPIPGDVNLNGVAYEIADAVLFSNYFVYGLGVFTIDQRSQIAATDANGDGLTLALSDLTFMLRKADGDDNPNLDMSPVEALYTIDVNGRIIILPEVGAATLQLRGSNEPTLLADNMELQYAFDVSNNVTRVLVYSTQKGEIFSGEFININGAELVSFEMATYEGAPMITTRVDSLPYLVLNQNIPNPFDGRTTIKFFIKYAQRVLFEVIDEDGQIVYDFNRGYYSIGWNEIDWYGTDNDGHLVPDGVYNYSITDFGRTETKELIIERHL